MSAASFCFRADVNIWTEKTFTQKHKHTAEGAPSPRFSFFFFFAGENSYSQWELCLRDQKEIFIKKEKEGWKHSSTSDLAALTSEPMYVCWQPRGWNIKQHYIRFEVLGVPSVFVWIMLLSLRLFLLPLVESTHRHHREIFRAWEEERLRFHKGQTHPRLIRSLRTRENVITVLSWIGT